VGSERRFYVPTRTYTRPVPSPGRAERIATALSALGTPPAVRVDGASMEPSLRLGWRVRIEPLPPSLAPGDVVLLRAATGELVLHRLLHFDTREPAQVLHRGDARGGTGVAPASALVGLATSVIDPPDTPFPDLDRLPADIRQGFEAARARALRYSRGRRLLQALPLPWLRRRGESVLRRAFL
jgi:hypothetical protein